MTASPKKAKRIYLKYLAVPEAMVIMLVESVDQYLVMVVESVINVENPQPGLTSTNNQESPVQP